MFTNIKNKIKIKHVVCTAISLLAFPGFVWFMLPSFVNSAVINESFIEYVNNNTLPKSINTTVKQERIYRIDTAITDVSGAVITGAKIENINGELVWDAGAGASFSANTSVFLKAGDYNVTFTFDSNKEINTPVDIEFKIS